MISYPELPILDHTPVSGATGENDFTLKNGKRIGKKMVPYSKFRVSVLEKQGKVIGLVGKPTKPITIFVNLYKSVS